MQYPNRSGPRRRGGSLSRLAALMVICAPASASVDGLRCSAGDFLGSYDGNASAVDVAVAGNRAYVLFHNILRLIDISDPAAPKSLDSSFGENSRAVAVDGSIACVLRSTSLAILDVSDPMDMRVVGSYGVTSARDVALVGDTAYVTDNDGLRILDLSNPAAPQQLGFLPHAPGSATGLAVADGIVYCGGWDQFRLIDVSNPSNPLPLGSLNVGCVDVKVNGGFAFLADWFDGVHVIDVTNPGAPASLASFTTTYAAEGLDIAGSTLYVADNEAGLQVFDITNPAAPVQVGSYDTPGEAEAVAVQGGIAYIADSDAGLRLIDVSDPISPLLGSWGDNYLIDDLAVSGTTAYLAAWGVQIVDCTNPLAPKQRGYYSHGKTAYAIALGGPVAYIVAKDSELVCVNVSNPNAPSRVGLLVLPDPVLRDIAIAGNTAFIAGHTGLHTVDVSNPAAPLLLNSAGVPFSADRVIAAGSRAYVIASDSLYIFDASNPAAPVLLGVSDQGGTSLTGIAVAGNTAYVVTSSGYFAALDVSNPAAPVRLDSIFVPDKAEDLALYGTYACITIDDSSLQLLDISNPAQLSWVASQSMRIGYAKDIAVLGDIAYVSGNYPGLTLVDLSDCGPPPCPAGPSDLLTSEPFKGVATLAWTDNAFNETGFRVRREQYLQGQWKNGQVVATLPTDSTTFAQSPGQGFWRYQVQAFTAECDSAWTELKSVPAAMPGGPTVTKVNGSAKIDWIDNTNFEAKYIVQRQQKVGNKWLNTTTVGNLPKNTITFTNSPGAGTWRYRVRANSTAGNSPYTVWKSVTLP